MNQLIHLILVLAVMSNTGQAAKLRAVSAPGGSGPIIVGKGGLSAKVEKQAKPRRQLMDMINAFRAEVCAKMKDKHGSKFKTFAKCKEFMEEACNPGKDMRMDRDKTEVTTRKGYCREYFAEKEAEEELKKQVGDEEAKKVIDGEPPAPAPSPDMAPAPVPAPEPETTTAPAPAPAPEPVTSAPAPPAPAPVAEEKKDKVEDDMEYYFKDEGKSKERMHMDESLKLPTQGYWGKLIEHEDMETMTTDWGREFGRQQYDTRDGFKTYEEICKKYPHNPWCLKHHLTKHKSSAYTTSAHLLASALPILLGLALA